MSPSRSDRAGSESFDRADALEMQHYYDLSEDEERSGARGRSKSGGETHLLESDEAEDILALEGDAKNMCVLVEAMLDSDSAVSCIPRSCIPESCDIQACSVGAQSFHHPSIVVMQKGAYHLDVPFTVLCKAPSRSRSSAR